MAGTLSTQRRRNLLPSLARSQFPGMQQLEELIENFWDEVGDGWGTQLLAPPLDMSETDKDVCLRLDVPGVKPKEIDVQVNGNQLTISGERKEEKEEKGETFHRIERRAGRFSRCVTLPCAVQEDKIDAQYKDGVLSITMPKTAESKTRHIEIKT